MSASATTEKTIGNSGEAVNKNGYPVQELNPAYTIILFYQYTKVANPEAFMNWNKYHAGRLGLTGRVLIAKEGINATLEGKTADINAYIELVRGQDGGAKSLINLKETPIKTSMGTGSAFPNLKVKVRKEIVALGLGESGEEDVDPTVTTGVHLQPEELKKWYENNDDFVVIDMRNDFEYKVGRFRNSINPGLDNFRDLPKALPKLIEQHPDIANKKVLTVCTGGVRCEKASGYLIKKGFKDVYQLDGGMHVFMEKFGDEAKDFEGSLYTFDNRITMDFTKEREVVGACDVCDAKTERYDHCANDMCHKHILVCEGCHKDHVYTWCTSACKQIGRRGMVKPEGGEFPGKLVKGAK